jgi:uncharacterized protein YegL
MNGQKIQSMNFAIREAIPEMRSEERSYPYVRLMLRLVEFSTGARWVQREPAGLDTFKWQDLAVREGGQTDTGAALSLVAQELEVPPLSEGHLAPILVLISDGMPTDPAAYDAGLRAIVGCEAGRKATRIAVAIGHDASVESLRRFATIEPVRAEAIDLAPIIAAIATRSMRVVSESRQDAERSLESDLRRRESRRVLTWDDRAEAEDSW